MASHPFCDIYLAPHFLVDIDFLLYTQEGNFYGYCNHILPSAKQLE